MAKYLGSVSYFKNMPDALKLLLADRFVTKIFDEGSFLCKEGEIGKSMFLVFSGSLVILKNGVVVNRAGPNETVGTSALETEKPRNASVQATMESFILELTQQNYHLVMSVTPLPLSI